MAPIIWGGPGGSFWADNDLRYEAMLAPMTPHLLAAAELSPQDHVLDVGCGCGPTSRQAARTAASVLGVDIDEAMLAKARQRSAGIPNLRFELADAQTAEFEPVDVVLSQFGVMFFDDPVAAFANLRRTLRPGGQLAFLCWQEHERMENRRLKREVLAPYVTLPELAPGEGATSLADPDRVRDLLGTAGFTDVTLTGVEERMPAGDDADDAAAFQLAEPSWAELLTEASPEATAEATEALRAAYAERGVLLTSAAWVVTAR